MELSCCHLMPRSASICHVFCRAHASGILQSPQISRHWRTVKVPHSWSLIPTSDMCNRMLCSNSIHDSLLVKCRCSQTSVPVVCCPMPLLLISISCSSMLRTAMSLLDTWYSSLEHRPAGRQPGVSAAQGCRGQFRTYRQRCSQSWRHSSHAERGGLLCVRGPARACCHWV